MSKITLPPYQRPQFMFDPMTGKPLYTAEQMQERDRQVVEHVIRACAQAVKALRDSHCTATEGAPPEYVCAPDGVDCDFVAAWNDASAAILSLLPVNPAAEAAMKRLADISDEMGLEK